MGLVLALIALALLLGVVGLVVRAVTWLIYLALLVLVIGVARAVLVKSSDRA